LRETVYAVPEFVDLFSVVAGKALDRFDMFSVRDLFGVDVLMTRFAGKVRVGGPLKIPIVNEQRDFLPVPFHGERCITMTDKTPVVLLCPRR
jgi:hypothetical protein